MDIRAIQSD